MALNTTKPPFDDINVRKAVIAELGPRGAARRPAAARCRRRSRRTSSRRDSRVRGGRRSRGPAGLGVRLRPEPDGRPGLAASYMKKAGFSSGKCEGSDCTITMVGDNAPPASNTVPGGQGPARPSWGSTSTCSRSTTTSCTRSSATFRRTSRTCARTWAGSRTSTIPSRSSIHVQRRRHRAVEQLQLAAAQRQGDQHSDMDKARLITDPAAAGPDVGQDRRRDHRRWRRRSRGSGTTRRTSSRAT